jgi:hypothetical protein
MPSHPASEPEAAAAVPVRGGSGSLAASAARLWPLLRPHRRRLLAGCGCVLVVVACWPLLALLAGRLIPAIGAGDLTASLRTILLALLVFLVQKAAQFGQDSLLADPALHLGQGVAGHRRKGIVHPVDMFIAIGDHHRTGNMLRDQGQAFRPKARTFATSARIPR